MRNNKDNRMLVRYKNPPRNREILTLPPLTMQENSYQDQHFHSHAPINLAHTMGNPLTPARLSPASLTITSPDSVITEFCFNSQITDLYYAKGYLPNATLTGYKDGVLKTAVGRAYLCFHFDPADPRIFDLASMFVEPTPPGSAIRAQPHDATALNVAEDTINALPLINHPPPPRLSPPNFLFRSHGAPVAASTSPATTATYHVTVGPPVAPPQPPSVPRAKYATFFIPHSYAKYNNPITFSSLTATLVPTTIYHIF